MINKRLIGLVPDSMSYIKKHVLVKWISLAFNILLIFAVCEYLQQLLVGRAGTKETVITLAVILASMAVRAVTTKASVRLSFLASKQVKKSLRQQIYEKLLKLGASYAEQIPTSEVVQISVEGVEQLETYFGAYLPQFFYCMIAPFTLFLVLAFVSLKAAIVLLICVPLIPISIVAVQKIAKKIMEKGPVAIQMAKLSINMGCNVDMNTGLMIERLSQTIALSTEDRKEGTLAFLEKRPAQFKGR